MNTLKKLLTLLLLGIMLAACSPESYQPGVLNLGQATLLLPGHDKPTPVTYEVIDDLAIFEGDIILGKVDSKRRLVHKELESQGVGIEGDTFRWPGGNVPFVISGNWGANDAAMRDAITRAVNHWNATTVIRLVPRSNETDFINFTSGTGCASFVGRQGGGQSIILQTGCGFGAVVHEIGHAVGLWHEQSREDRDRFVTINWQNIQTGMAFNFDKHVTDGFDIGSYDYNSIMHYGAFAFSNNNLPTITTIPAAIPIGQRNGLSAGDIAAVRTLYLGFNLRVVITGATTTVPSSPGVVVKRADGTVVARLTRSTTLTSLRAGDYTVTAPTFSVGSSLQQERFFPDRSSKKVAVPGNAGTATVTFVYDSEITCPGFCP